MFFLFLVKYADTTCVRARALCSLAGEARRSIAWFDSKPPPHPADRRVDNVIARRPLRLAALIDSWRLQPLESEPLSLPQTSVLMEGGESEGFDEERSSLLHKHVCRSFGEVRAAAGPSLWPPPPLCTLLAAGSEFCAINTSGNLRRY